MRNFALSATLFVVVFACSCSRQEPAASPTNTQSQFTAAKLADGAGGRFTFRFAHGGSPLAFAQVLFGGADVSSPPFCFIHYDPAAQDLKLYKGPNPLDFTPGAKPGTASAVVQNDYCRIDASASSAVDSTNELLLTVVVQFDSRMAGDRNVYQRSLDAAGTDTNWQRVGSWTVSSPK